MGHSRYGPPGLCPRCLLSDAQGGKGKRAEAEAAYRAALKVNPDDAVAHYNLGTTLATQGRLDEAVAQLRAAIRLKPDDAEAHGNLGNALTAQGNLEEAAPKDQHLYMAHECGVPRSALTLTSPNGI